VSFGLFLDLRSTTSGWPTSQKLSLLDRFFFKSSVNRSAFIWALSVVTPGQFNSSMSLAASGSNWIAAKTINLGLGTSFRASSMANSICRCSNGACSGPKETTTRRRSVAAPSRTFMAPSSLGLVSASACNQRVPESGSTRENRIICPPLPRIPARSSSLRHSSCRTVSPERETDSSAGVGVAVSSPASAAGDFTIGEGTASTVNGPVTRVLELSGIAWS